LVVLHSCIKLLRTCVIDSQTCNSFLAVPTSHNRRHSKSAERDSFRFILSKLHVHDHFLSARHSRTFFGDCYSSSGFRILFLLCLVNINL